MYFIAPCPIFFSDINASLEILFHNTQLWEAIKVLLARLSYFGEHCWIQLKSGRMHWMQQQKVSGSIT